MDVEIEAPMKETSLKKVTNKKVVKIGGKP